MTCQECDALRKRLAETEALRVMGIERQQRLAEEIDRRGRELEKCRATLSAMRRELLRLVEYFDASQDATGEGGP